MIDFHTISPFAGLKTVVWGICCGLAVALFVSSITKAKGGSLIRALIQSGASTPESAKSLMDLNIKPTVIMKKMLKKRGTLRRVVLLKDSDSFLVSPKRKTVFDRFFGFKDEPIEKMDFNIAKFYLSEELRPRAEVRFLDGKLSPVMFILFLFLIIGLGALATYAIPKLVDFSSLLFHNGGII